MSSKAATALRAVIRFSVLGLLTGCANCPSASRITASPSIQIAPANLAPSLVPGGSVQIAVTATFSGGPTSATMALGGTLPAGVTHTFAPTTVTNGMTSTLTLTADSTARAGLFVFEVVANEAGSSFGVSDRSQITGNVLVPFTLMSPGSRSLTVGTGDDFVIGVSRTAPFIAPVGIVVDPTSVPAGTTIAIAPPTVTGANTTVRLDLPLSAATGQYLVRTIGKYGASLDTLRFLLTVQAAPVPPDITLATPATANIVPGGSATFDLATTRNIGTLGMGNITLAFSGVPNGATASLTPSNIAAANSQLVVTTTTAIPDGSYPITVTATLGSLVRTTTATLVVATPADFTLSMTPAALTIARNASAQSTVGIQRTGPVAGVTIDAVSLPAGVTMSTNPTAISGLSAAFTFSVSNAAVPGTYPIVIRGTAGALTRTTTLTLTIPAPPPSNVTVQVMTPNVSVPTGGTTKIPIKLTRTSNAIGQLLELRLTGIPIGGNAWIAPSFTTGDTATLYVIGGTPGTATLVVTVALGAFPPSDRANVTVTASDVPDFAVVPAPQTLNMSTGSFVPLGVEIWRKNGFTAPVTFSATGDLAGQYAFRFSLTQTTGSAVGFEIYASPNVPEGPHLITVRGTSGNTVREVTMTVFISATPSYPYPYYPYGIKPPP